MSPPPWLSLLLSAHSLRGHTESSPWETLQALDCLSHNPRGWLWGGGRGALLSRLSDFFFVCDLSPLQGSEGLLFVLSLESCCEGSFTPWPGSGARLGCQQSLAEFPLLVALGDKTGGPWDPLGKLPPLHIQEGHPSPRLPCPVPTPAEARVQVDSWLDAQAGPGLGTCCPGGQAGGSGGAPTPGLRSPSNLSQLHYSWPAESPETQPHSSSSLRRAWATVRNVFQKCRRGAGAGERVHLLGPEQVRQARVRSDTTGGTAHSHLGRVLPSPPRAGLWLCCPGCRSPGRSFQMPGSPLSWPLSLHLFKALVIQPCGQLGPCSSLLNHLPQGTFWAGPWLPGCSSTCLLPWSGIPRRPLAH